MSEDHTQDTKHHGEDSDDGYNATLLAYANDEDLEKEEEEADAEDEEEDEDMEEKVKTSRGNIKDSKKITLPFFLQLDTEVMDCPFLLSFHFLSSVLLHYHFVNFLSPYQIQQAAIHFITTKDYKNTCYTDVDTANIKQHVQDICTVDPDMLCWRNYHLCYLFSFWLNKKKVNQLQPYQVKLRRKCWYYVIIFLRERERER